MPIIYIRRLFHLCLGILITITLPSALLSEENMPAISTNEIIVTANRHKTNLFDSPYSINIFTEKDITKYKLPRTSADIFINEPSIMVTKTSYGQGSPFFRGFTGFRTLLLIDGIRLNNSVFREGPNQYWNTIDPYVISQLEVIKGPSSSLYGSDAIGGTLNTLTISGNSQNENFNWERRINYKYASADKSNVLRVDARGGKKNKFNFILGTSIKNFNDLNAGKDVGLESKTGYDEIDYDLKFEYYTNLKNKLIFAYQHSKHDDAWRTHKTIYGISWEGTTIGSEKKRSFDQQRDLFYCQYHINNPFYFMNNIKLSLSYHLQQEDRTRIKSSDKSDIQGFDVGTLGFWGQASTPSSIGLFTYGFEYYTDNVDSYKTKFNPDGSLDKKEIQGPVGDNASYDLIGLFVQNETELNHKIEFISGIRLNYANTVANKVKDPNTGNIISIKDNWNNISGNLRFLYKFSNEINLFSGISQGFRAPNLSDLTRFDSNRSNEIETPSPGLTPEKFLSYEIGSKLKFSSFTGQLSAYYTDINNMIIRYPTGNVIDGEYEIQKANAGNGYVNGVEMNLIYKLYPTLSIIGGFALQKGKVDTYPTSLKNKTREPISRLMPTTSILGIKWQNTTKKYWAECTLKHSAKQAELSTRDKSDTQRIPPGGTPGYTVINITGGINFTEKISSTISIENLTNEDYRIHGSGQNEAGLNLILSTNFVF